MRTRIRCCWEGCGESTEDLRRNRWVQASEVPPHSSSGYLCPLHRRALEGWRQFVLTNAGGGNGNGKPVPDPEALKAIFPEVEAAPPQPDPGPAAAPEPVEPIEVEDPPAVLPIPGRGEAQSQPGPRLVVDNEIPLPRPAPETEPAPEPEPRVDGAALLDAVQAVLVRYLSLPPGAAEVLTLWIAFSHCVGAFDIAPRLVLTSPVRRCGKSTVLWLLRHLCANAMDTSNLTKGIYRILDAFRPTLLIDEADTHLSARSEVTGILNSGHSRASAHVINAHGKFSTFAAIALASIGDLPPQLVDRSFRAEMQRKLPDEITEKFSERRSPELHTLRDLLARWVAQNFELLCDDDEPEVPAQLHDRAADNAAVLLKVAEVIGADWPARARGAILKLQPEDETSPPETLLADVYDLLATPEFEGPRIESALLVTRLRELDDGSWADLTAAGLAKMLRPFKLKPKVMRAGAALFRGYERGQLVEVSTRYRAKRA